MPRTKTTKKEVRPKATRRFASAKRNLLRMQKNIAPYAKRSKIEQISTAGQWSDSAALNATHITS